MRGLTFKQLEALRAIARLGTVTGAAGAVGITASAMTTRLKELEAIAGFALFDRTAAGFRVNHVGAVMLRMANHIHDAMDLAEGTLADLRGVTAGSVVVGITSTAKYFAPRLVADFARRHPRVDISLIVGNRLETIDALKRMAVDLAIMGRPPPKLDLIAEPFGDHPMIVIAPPDHPFAGRAALLQSDIVGERFLMREEGSGTRTVFEEVFPSARTYPRHLQIEIGSNETIKQGVMAGMGLALISAHTVAFEVEMGRLAVLDVRGFPILRKWFVAYHRDKSILPAMRAFWDFTLAEGQSHLPVTRPPQ
jgi:DNA-binding transcriptional LysR family regulator